MNGFFALMNRMKFIDRWGLMNCTRGENVMEHSAMTAMLAHALALTQNKLTGSALDASRAALLGLYHEAAEVITGDLPTPVKYFNAKITSAYKEIEREAEKKIVQQIPAPLRQDLQGLVSQDKNAPESRIVKAADKLAALIKCTEETMAGNGEFNQAHEATLRDLKDMRLACVDYFLEELLPPFRKNLDDCFD